MARCLKFWIKEEEEMYHVAKTKALISFADTAKLICPFCFRIGKTKIQFSHEAVQLTKITLHLDLFRTTFFWRHDFEICDTGLIKLHV